MCITVNHAKLSGTKILSIPVENGKHFIAYSNKAQNLSGKPNAMILPIPGETKQEWFYDTTKYKNFMEEITEKCDYGTYLGVLFRSLSSKSAKFDQFELGMYTVGLSKDFGGVEEFINSLPENKKPEISESLKSFFKEKCAGWSFVVCVFDTEKTIDAQPIAFEYTPFNYDLIYFPTVDSHDGGAPNLKELVEADHTFIYEHTGPTGENKLMQEFVTLKAEVPEFLNKRKYRAKSLRGKYVNGDTYINISNINDINFSDEPHFERSYPTPFVPENV